MDLASFSELIGSRHRVDVIVPAPSGRNQWPLIFAGEDAYGVSGPRSNMLLDMRGVAGRWHTSVKRTTGSSQAS